MKNEMQLGEPDGEGERITTNGAAPAMRSSWLRAALMACAAAAVCWTLAPPVLTAAAHFLMANDPLAPATAVVVLGGQVPFCALEAAELYKQHLAAEVWLTQGAWTAEEAELAKLGIDRPADHIYSREVLLRTGVPATAIRILPGHNTNTADEIRTIASALPPGQPNQRVIIVTSKYHTRRAKVIWQRLAADRADLRVRYTPGDPFEPDRWWRNSGDIMAVSREVFGILNALAGFPLRSDRH